MKRFYKDVSTVCVDGCYQIHLDARPVKLSETRDVLRLESKTIAEAISTEWDDQKETIIPDSMPIMQIVSTCMERVAVQRTKMQEQILRYVDTDLLFYRTDEADLGPLQAAAWDPLLESFKKYCDAEIKTTKDLVALRQDNKLHQAIESFMNGYSDAEFTVFQIVVPLLGSVISGVLFMNGDIDPETSLAIARVEERYKDELYNSAKYGQDPSIEKSDQAAMRDLIACKRYLSLIAEG